MFIEIKGLQVPTIIGVYPQERLTTQMVTVDLVVELSNSSLNLDSLDLTIDYTAIADCVFATLAKPGIELVETAAQAIARDLVSSFVLAKSVSATVTKHKIPDPRFNQVRVSVRANCARDSLGGITV